MKEKIKEDNQQQNALKNKTSWRRHFTGKNLWINGLIAFIPATIIYGILREEGMGGVLILFGIMFGLMCLVGKIREKIKRLLKSIR